MLIEPQTPGSTGKSAMHCAVSATLTYIREIFLSARVKFVRMCLRVCLATTAHDDDDH